MTDFRMPALGADVDAGTVVEWLVKPGDTVKRGQVVVMVETDKGLVEVEIFDEGVVESLLVAPGTKVPSGTPLASIRGAASAERVTPAPVATAPPAPAAPAAPAPSPIVPPPPPLPHGEVRASPAARALAAQLGIDLTGLAGTGPDGAVTRADVAAAAPAPVAAPATPATRAAAMRRAIAAAMTRAKRDIPHYYLGTSVDMSRATAWLAAENARRPPAERLLPTALVVRAVARAAREVPEMNGTFVDGGFRPADSVHVGVAVALRGGGLVAPAIHDADRKSADEIMRALLDVVARVRAGSMRSSELTDATITVTNLGEQGVETVFGVIYPPQVALVGVGTIAARPRVVDGAVVARPVAALTLSADHRASDGHRGARFLAAIDRLLQQPEAP